MRAPFVISAVCLLLTACDRKMNDSANYDLEMKEEPSAWVRVTFQDAKESQKFSDILKEFAQAHSIAESSFRAMPYAPSSATNRFKTIPVYQSSDVLISSFCVLADEDAYGQSRMHVLRRDFAPADFKRLADDFFGRFQQAFSNRLQTTFEDERK